MRAKNEMKLHGLYEQLIERIVRWAETRADVRAAIVVGSRARVDHPADDWADLDVIVIASDPKLILSPVDWLQNIGNPLLTFLEPTGTGEEMERRVLFEGMLDVDFSVVPKSRVDELLQKGIPPEFSVQFSNIFGRGMRVLLDKDGTAVRLQRLLSTIEASSPRAPTQSEFLEVVNDFLYHAVFTAKHLVRGELWWAKMCNDCHMQQLMLRMIEWYSRTERGWNYDTWFRGRFLEEWAEPRVLKKLRGAFAHYDTDDVCYALSNSMELFHWIASETAEKLNYQYPTEPEKQITEWIQTCLSRKGERATKSDG